MLLGGTIVAALLGTMVSKRRTNRKTRIFVYLSILICVEIFVFLIVWHKTQAVAKQGYVIKNGKNYILLWRNNDDSLQTRYYSYLNEALEFAADELKMSVGPNPTSRASVEGVWSRDEIGKRLLFWQTAEQGVAHRLSFHRPYEASVFEKAFRSGAYSTSPYGHSISLIPMK